LDDATAHLKEAVRLKPDSGAALGKLGLVFARQGKLTEAIEEYEKAPRLDPGSLSVHFKLGQALEALGESNRAGEHYSKHAYPTQLQQRALTSGRQGVK